MKPGYKTTEFWLTAAGILATTVAPVFEGASGTKQGIMAAILAGIYTASRAYVKGK